MASITPFFSWLVLGRESFSVAESSISHVSSMRSALHAALSGLALVLLCFMGSVDWSTEDGCAVIPLLSGDCLFLSPFFKSIHKHIEKTIISSLFRFKFNYLLI